MDCSCYKFYRLSSTLTCGEGRWSLESGHTKEAWQIVRNLAGGASAVQKRAAFRLADEQTGRVAETAAGTAKIFWRHLEARHSSPVEFDAAAIESLGQQPYMEEMDAVPTKAEVASAARRAKSGTSTGYHGVPAVGGPQSSV